MISTKEAATLLDMDDSQVRRLIRQGTIPATLVGKTWIIDQTELASLDIRKHKHRNPRAKVTRLQVQRADPQSQYYWIDNPIAAGEVARIAEQVYGGTSTISIEDLTPGEGYWRVANPNVIDKRTWDQLSEVAFRFLREQQCRLPGNRPVNTILRLRNDRTQRTYTDCICGSPSQDHEPWCRNGNVITDAE